MAGKWKIFPVENIHKLSGCRKEHADHFPVENGSNFPVESENFPDTPMETLVMHPTNTEDARNGAGQSQTCRVLETPNTLCKRNMCFLLLGFWANFPEYFPEKRVMRNGFFFSDPSRLMSNFSRKGFCRNPRGIFRTKSRVNSAGEFLVVFFGPFSLEKIGGKNPPKNPRQNSNRNLGVSRQKSTLQGSGLDSFRAPRHGRKRPLEKGPLRGL